jgi:hypothetical protein
LSRLIKSVNNSRRPISGIRLNSMLANISVLDAVVRSADQGGAPVDLR